MNMTSFADDSLIMQSDFQMEQDLDHVSKWKSQNKLGLNEKTQTFPLENYRENNQSWKMLKVDSAKSPGLQLDKISLLKIT